jgi:hypothetical protein
MLVWLDRPDGSWSAGATGRAINPDRHRDRYVVVRQVLSSLPEYNVLLQYREHQTSKNEAK